jgi:hypothetical protein
MAKTSYIYIIGENKLLLYHWGKQVTFISLGKTSYFISWQKQVTFISLGKTCFCHDIKVACFRHDIQITCFRHDIKVTCFPQ